MMPPSLLLAAWFVHPALLGGLGLVLLPIIIHLLSRRQFWRIEWGATRFLLEAEKESRRRIRFEQWLLVALRCLALALLALLVARPFVQPGLVAALLGGRGQVHRVILIDDSASLAFHDGTRPDFTPLREAGQRLLGWLHEASPGDVVSVYLTSQPTDPLIAGQRLTAASLADLQARIGQLEPVNLAARPGRVLETVAEDLAAAGRGPHADLYILSDFQRSDWLGLRAAADGVSAGPPGSVFEPLGRLDPDDVRVVLIAAGTAERDNVAVLAVEPERPQTVAGLPAVLHATLVNYSGKPLEGARVQVEADGAPLPALPVETIAPGKSRVVPLEVTFPEEGFSELAVGVDALDGLRADNTRRLGLPVKRNLRVLLVDGQPATEPTRDEVYFLRNALAPAGPFSSGIRVQTTDPDQLEATALDAFDCVLLCNVAAPGQGAVATLERYVSAGGGLALFLGDQIGAPEEYNRALYGGGEGLLPLAVMELCRRDENVAAGVPAGPGVGLVRATDHPVTALFPAGGASLSELVHFRAYYRCAEPAGASSATQREPLTEATGQDVAASQPGVPPAAVRAPATVLARFTDEAQTPALVERAFGRGRVMLFTSSVDLDWNDWARALDGSYVVTLLELVQYIGRRNEDRGSFVAGETLTLALLPEEYQPSAAFRPPAFPDEPATEGRVRGLLAAVGEPVVLEGPVAARLGTYTAELVRRDGSIELRPLAVNLEAGESDLAVARPPELDAALGNLPHEYLLAADAFRQDEAQARRELWPAVLLAVVVLLMLEQTLAWWFGLPGGVAGLRRRSWRLFTRSTGGIEPGCRRSGVRTR